MRRWNEALAWALAVDAGAGVVIGVVGLIVPGSVPWWAILAPWLVLFGLTALAILRVA